MQKQLLGYPSKAGPVSRQLWQIWDRLNTCLAVWYAMETLVYIVSFFSIH